MRWGGLMNCGSLKRTIRQALLLLFLASLPAAGRAWLGFDSSQSPLPRRPGEISLADALSSGRSVLWIDARSGAEYRQQHIPGALLLNEDQWSELLSKVVEAWDPDGIVVVYCGSSQCQAGAGVAKRLREELGWADVYELHGGWEAWRERGRP